MFFTISFLKLGPMLSPGPFHLTSLFTFFIVPGILPRTLHKVGEHSPAEL